MKEIVPSSFRFVANPDDARPGSSHTSPNLMTPLLRFPWRYPMILGGLISVLFMFPARPPRAERSDEPVESAPPRLAAPVVPPARMVPATAKPRPVISTVVSLPVPSSEGPASEDKRAFSPSVSESSAFQFGSDAAAGEGAVVSHNPAHGFQITLEAGETGRTVIHFPSESLTRASEAEPALTWRLAWMGYEGGLAPPDPVLGPARFNGSEAEWERPGVIEWFRQHHEGLEHGFTVSERPWSASADQPPASGPLRLHLEMWTPLAPWLEAEGRGRLWFSDPSTGESRLAYEHLLVTDATGREVPSHMELAAAPSSETLASGTAQAGEARPLMLALVIQDHEAAYPLRVDPTLVSVPVVPKLDVAYAAFEADPRDFVTFGSRVYFGASDPVYGRELWKTDGTREGTVMVADLVPGDGSSNPRRFIVLGDTLLFVAEAPGATTSQLWKTDGTAEGTQLLRQIHLGQTADDPLDLAIMDGVLYFMGTTTATGRELWRTDGTVAGTWVVKDIVPGSGSSLLRSLTVCNGKLYFLVSGVSENVGLWKSDGTVEGTIFVNLPLQIDGGRSALAEWNGRLYFGARDAESVRGLWKSDGTPEGSILVAENLGGLAVDTVTSTESLLFFRTSQILWRSDGTAEGTFKVRENGLSTSRDTYGRFPALIPVGNRIYFIARPPSGEGPATGDELWTSDGTVEGTALVKDINPGPRLSSPDEFFVFNDLLYFRADDGVHGREWWKTDGTTEGTVLLKDIRPGAGDSSTSANAPAILGSHFIFRARVNPSEAVKELWKSDGTAEGTVPIRQFPKKGLSRTEWAALGETLIFQRYDAQSGWELWKSDGTAEGTLLIKDINPGPADGSPESFVEYGPVLLFLADDGVHGRELWRTDGTPAGTMLVKDIQTGPASLGRPNLIPFGGHCYFAVSNVSSLVELWKTDGSSAGTASLPGFGEPHQPLIASALRVLNDKLVFLASEGEGEIGWWQHDGSPEGFRRIADAELTGSYHLAFMTSIRHPMGGDALLYYESQERVLRVLTASGTVGRIAQLNIGDSIISLNGVAYFSASETNSNFGLWKSDGTVEGTQRIRNLGGNHYFHPFEEKLFFSATQTSFGTEPWISDGSAAGTMLLKDIFPGRVSSNFPYGFRRPALHRGLLYFGAADNLHGWELWQTDGTPEGTMMVEDLAPGYPSSVPEAMISVGEHLYYIVQDDGSGQGALRRLSPAPPLPFAGGNLTTATGHEALLSLEALLAGLDPGVSVAQVETTSAQGGRIELTAAGLRYLPPAGLVGTDTFTVVLSDGQQGIVTTTVFPSEWLEQVEILSLTASALTLRFHGFTGRAWRIERSTDLLDWQSVATLVADENGEIHFTDDTLPPGHAYYRRRAE